jgi:hypothetical protein
MQYRLNLALLLASLLLVTQIAFAQSDKISSGIISGRVLLGEKPAPNVTVLARDTQSNLPEAEAIKARAVTDAEGYYKLTGLAAGNYIVVPRTPTHVVRESFVRNGEPGRSVTLGEGESVEKIDFTLTKGGVITGRVIDHEGKPVVGERVSLWTVNEQGQAVGFWIRNFRMLEIDDRGVYRVYGLPAGRYKISAGSTNDAVSLCYGCGKNYLRRTFYPNVTEEAAAHIVEVTPGGEATGIDITLAGSLKSFDVLARVVDAETSQPVAGVQCGYGLLSPDGKQMYSSSYGMMSGANGEVYFHGFLPGRYGAFTVGLPGYYSDVTVFEITDSDLKNIEIKMRRGASLSGQIVLNGSPDAAALARLRQMQIYAHIIESPELVASITRQFKQAPDGSFTLTGLPPGRAHLNLDYHANRESGFAILGVEHNGAFAREGIAVKAGEALQGVRVLVMAAGRGVIRGQVQVVNGTLPEGVQLRVTGIPKNIPAIPPQLLPVHSLLDTMADDRGRFVFEKLSTGEYELEVSVLHNPRLNIQPPKLLRPIRQMVTVSEGETQVVLKIDLAAQTAPRKEGNL